MAASIFHRLRRAAAVCRFQLEEIALAILVEVTASALHLSALVHVAVSVVALIVRSRFRARRR